MTNFYEQCGLDVENMIMGYKEDFERSDYYKDIVMKELMNLMEKRMKYVEYTNETPLDSLDFDEDEGEPIPNDTDVLYVVNEMDRENYEHVVKSSNISSYTAFHIQDGEIVIEPHRLMFFYTTIYNGRYLKGGNTIIDNHTISGIPIDIFLTNNH